MAKRLIIVGAGGLGREVLTWARHVAEATRPDWTIGGLLDVNPRALDGHDVDAPLILDTPQFCPGPDDLFVCAQGDPEAKLRIARDLQRRGARFINLIHPTAIIGTDCRIGAGLVACPFSVVTTNVTIGDFVTLNIQVTVGHDVVIGDGCSVSPHADVNGNVTINEGVLLGTHCALLPGVRIGSWARVGAGSVVLRHVRPYTTVMGVPAKRVYSTGGPTLSSRTAARVLSVDPPPKAADATSPRPAAGPHTVAVPIHPRPHHAGRPSSD